MNNSAKVTLHWNVLGAFKASSVLVMACFLPVAKIAEVQLDWSQRKKENSSVPPSLVLQLLKNSSPFGSLWFALGSRNTGAMSCVQLELDIDLKASV